MANPSLLVTQLVPLSRARLENSCNSNVSSTTVKWCAKQKPGESDEEIRAIEESQTEGDNTGGKRVRALLGRSVVKQTRPYVKDAEESLLSHWEKEICSSDAYCIWNIPLLVSPSLSCPNPISAVSSFRGCNSTLSGASSSFPPFQPILTRFLSFDLPF